MSLLLRTNIFFSEQCLHGYCLYPIGPSFLSIVSLIEGNFLCCLLEKKNNFEGGTLFIYLFKQVIFSMRI